MVKKESNVMEAVLDILLFIVVALYLVAKAIVISINPFYKPKLKNLSGERVLITGGGGGIGRLVALRLAKLQATVILWDINEQGIKETAKMVENVGGRAYAFVCDLADREDVYRMAEKTNKEAGQVTILINNAGVVSGKLLLETPDHLIQRTFDVNVLAHFWTTKAFLPNMVEQNHGHIVTVASMAGFVGINKLVDYCSSKFAAVGFNEALEVELSQQGIKGVKTTVICPYFIQSTGMFNDVNSRFLPTLKSNDVADRIVDALRKEELFVPIPGFMKLAIILKHMLPWSVVSIVLKRLVPDAAPTPTQYSKVPENYRIKAKIHSSDMISNGERKP